MFYERPENLPYVIRKQLPKDALLVFFDAASPHDDETDALNSGWAAVGKGWRKSPVPGERWIKKGKPKTLYVSRPLLNGEDVAKWAKSQGFKTTLDPKDMHVTVAFSKQPFDISGLSADKKPVTVTDKGRSFDRFGEEKDAVVMKFSSADLEKRWREFRDAGASWDWDEYQPHLTLSYDGADVDLEKIVPFDGPLEFGPEVFDQVKEDWKQGITEKMASKIIKIDDEMRMVFGWASVITEKGKTVVDTQGDVIEPSELMKATTDFMEDARVAKAMHDGDGIGEVLHSFPLTNEIAKSLGIETDREGWIVGVKVNNDEIWKKVKDGTYRAFSIGGLGVREDVE